MRVYKFTSRRGYEQINVVDRSPLNAFDELNGEPRTKTWEPIRVRRVRPSLREGFRPSDSPYEGECLILRRSAVDALRDILDAHGKLLPLEDEGGVELYVYNPRALEALDHARTVGSRNENGLVYIPITTCFSRPSWKGSMYFDNERGMPISPIASSCAGSKPN